MLWLSSPIGLGHIQRDLAKRLVLQARGQKRAEVLERFLDDLGGGVDFATLLAVIIGVLFKTLPGAPILQAQVSEPEVGGGTV